MDPLTAITLAQTVTQGAKALKGGFDWMFGGKQTPEEKAQLDALKRRMTGQYIKDADVNQSIITGTRGAQSTVQDSINAGVGQLQASGLGDSVLTSQVGIKEKVDLADRLNTSALDLKMNQKQLNEKARKDAESEFLNLKNELARRRADVKANAFGEVVDNVGGAVSDHYMSKYITGSPNVRENTIMGNYIDPQRQSPLKLDVIPSANKMQYNPVDNSSPVVNSNPVVPSKNKGKKKDSLTSKWRR